MSAPRFERERVFEVLSFSVQVEIAVCARCGERQRFDVKEIMRTTEFGPQARETGAPYVATSCSHPYGWGFIASRLICPACEPAVEAAIERAFREVERCR